MACRQIRTDMYKRLKIPEKPVDSNILYIPLLHLPWYTGILNSNAKSGGKHAIY